MTLRVVFDTSALLDLFGRWTDDHRERRGDLVREVAVLAPLRPHLVSTATIHAEVRQLMVIGADLTRYVTFESLPDAEVAACAGFVSSRRADFSLIALVARLERAGDAAFLIAKDRTLARDLARNGLAAPLVPPTGFSEGLTVLAPNGSPGAARAHRVQTNTFVNLSRSMRRVRAEEGEGAYADWQEFLNAQTAAKHDLIEAMRATGIRL